MPRPRPDAPADNNRTPAHQQEYTLATSNTELLTRMITKRIGCDVDRIEAADPCPACYDQTVARNVAEEQADARPAIANALPDVARYDTVLLGSRSGTSTHP